MIHAEARVGFVGGGRIVRIMLGGWSRAHALPSRIIVSDTSTTTLDDLKRRFPSIEVAPGDNHAPARQDVVFVALHPPAMAAGLGEIKTVVASDAIVVSLAPKVTLGQMSALLGGRGQLARVIPNAPSITGAGYNPLAFAASVPAEARRPLMELLAPLGACPEVEESTLEAYAILTAMGPTYLWFQFAELLSLSRSFGLAETDARAGLQSMVNGTIRTLMDPQFASEAEVEDLIPVKPLASDEEAFRTAYRTRLTALHAKLTGS